MNTVQINNSTMATYTSDKVTLGVPAERVFDKLSNLEGLGELLARVPEDQIPAEHRETFGNIQITPDSLTMPGGPVGALTLRMKRKDRPRRIEMEGEGTPVPMSLTLDIAPLPGDMCETKAEINLGIPAMLAPMVSGPMKKMVQQFAQLLKAIPFE